MTTNVENPDVLIRCAPDKIERVMMNLLTNALRHTPSDGAIAISAESVSSADGGDVLIRVVDTGKGLTDDESDHVFDHFFRGDSARDASSGAGLGLAIAKGLVEAHGGEIWAENRPEGGASFNFKLPREFAS